MNSLVLLKYARLFAQGLSIGSGHIAKVPLILKERDDINSLVLQNISISKQDWDAHETSWDFEENPLLAVDTDTYSDNIHHEIERHEKETGEHLCIDPVAPELDSLEWRMEQYKQKWEHLFIQLHANEEELNRQFIDIYGLQDELIPDVPLDEITILQQGEIKTTDQYELCDSDGSVFADSDGAILTTSGDLYLDWQDDVVIKQFISYAVGCMMGRYRLDKKGLHIAHPDPTAEETAPYIYNNVEFEIDEDGIIPLMPNDCGFSDNAANRFSDFVRIALGDEPQLCGAMPRQDCGAILRKGLLERPQEDVSEPPHLLAIRLEEGSLPVYRLHAPHECLHCRAHPCEISPPLHRDPPGKNHRPGQPPLRPHHTRIKAAPATHQDARRMPGVSRPPTGSGRTSHSLRPRRRRSSQLCQVW